MDFLEIPSRTDLIEFHPGVELGVQLYLKRDDLIHPDISGNKWRKLKFNIEEAKRRKASTLITAGGPWSNHLAATAASGRLLGFKTIGFIRGEEPNAWSDTLRFCKDQGMKLIFIPRKDFDQLPNSVSHLLLDYMPALPAGRDAYFIPLGGENELGVEGCKEMMAEINMKVDYIALAVGTGTTMKGVAASVPEKRIIGFSALRESTQHSASFLHWVKEHPQLSLTHEYSFGGFAKSCPELENFIVEFHLQNKIRLDPVYTGKMMYGLFEMMKKGKFGKGDHIVAIHTGGLQGIKGFPDLHNRLFTS